MQTAQHLLDSFGSPPAEVCIDWAWQLVSLAEAGMLPEQFSWIDLQVSQSGKLAVQADCKVSNLGLASDPFHSSSFQSCVMQLASWSGADQAVLDTSSVFGNLENVQALLRELARQHRDNASSATEYLQPSSARQSAKSVGINALEETDSTQVATMSSSSSGIEPSSNSTAANLKSEAVPSKTDKLVSKANKSRLLLYASATAAVLLLAIGSWSLFGSKDESKRLAKSNINDPTTSSNGVSDSKQKSNNKTSSSSNSSKRTKKSTKSETSELDQLLGGSPNSQADSSEEVGAIADAAATRSSSADIPLLGSPSQSPTSTSDPLKELDLLDTKPSRDSLAIKEGDDRQATSATPSSAANSTESTSPTDKPASMSSADAQRLKLEVASETSQDSVAKLLANSASTDAKAISMNSSSESLAQSPAAFLLNVEDIVQIQEIPNKTRVREPAWELRLSSTSTMDVEPNGIQTLAEKSAVRWILSSRELKPRKNQDPTKVAVIAEIANKRGDIRWTIVAGTQDLPNLRFPMNQERLDQLLNTLQNYQQRLTISIEQIKAAMELPDFPKELKSFWTAQRRTFENEAKLTTRARQVVADASMLTSWMDRTIEVHGRLLDTSGNKNDVVLAFGQAEPKQKEEAP